MTTAYAQVRGSRTGTTIQTSSQTPVKTSSTSPDFLFGVFLFAVVVWVIFSAALLYHFKKFGQMNPTVRFAKVLYITGSLLLLFIALVSIL